MMLFLYLVLACLGCDNHQYKERKIANIKVILICKLE